jgi:hypothetical protein
MKTLVKSILYHPLHCIVLGGNFPLPHKQLTTDEIVALSAAERKKRTHVMARYNSTPRSRASAKAYVSMLVFAAGRHLAHMQL